MNFLAFTFSESGRQVLRLVKTVFEKAWEIPFSIPFFMFEPLTFGHVIYGMIFLDIGLIFVKHLLSSHTDGNDNYMHRL